MPGATTFSRRVCVDRYGNAFAPPDGAIGPPRDSRASPHASEFLADAASEGSYARAAHFMEAADCLPAAAAVDGSLDPFHVDRAIASCFGEPGTDGERQVMQCIWFGRAVDAADLLEAYAEGGLARAGNASATARYLRNNAEFVRSRPPSPGTITPTRPPPPTCAPASATTRA